MWGRAELRAWWRSILRVRVRASWGTLEGYAGGLSISPSGKRVAYWIDNERLEVREVDGPNRMARVRVAVGTLAWSRDETRVLVKRGSALRSGGLVWIALPPLATVPLEAAPATAEIAPRSILHDLEFRQFDISPDGKFLGVWSRESAICLCTRCCKAFLPPGQVSLWPGYSGEHPT